MQELPRAGVTGDSMPPARSQAQGWTGTCKSRHCQCLAEVGLYPLAVGQDRPSLPPPGVARMSETGRDARDARLMPHNQQRQPSYPARRVPNSCRNGPSRQKLCRSAHTHGRSVNRRFVGQGWPPRRESGDHRPHRTARVTPVGRAIFGLPGLGPAGAR